MFNNVAVYRPPETSIRMSQQHCFLAFSCGMQNQLSLSAVSLASQQNATDNKNSYKTRDGQPNQTAETRKPAYPNLLSEECWFIPRKARSQYNHYQTRNSSACLLSNARERSASRSVRSGGENAREGDVGSDFSQPPPQLRP